MSVDVNIVDFLALDYNAVLAAASSNVNIVPLTDIHYAYLNRISGYNPSTNAFNAIVGYIDSGGVYVPFSTTSVAASTVFNVQLDKYILPQLGAYFQITATTYPVTAQLMVDGYTFDLC